MKKRVISAAPVLLKEESAADNGYLYVDDGEHFIYGNYQPLLGDVDGDGGVTILDATVIQRWPAGLSCSDRIGKPQA